MDTVRLEYIAKSLVADNKGILAADESNSTIKKRFDSAGIVDSEENRRAYRELLFTAPGIDKYISGVIMFDETIRQADADGIPFTKLLARRRLMVGIKADQGTKPLLGSAEELVTVGLEGLSERLQEYKRLGAQFAKWRAVIKISVNLPTRDCLAANAQALAEYARVCQAADIMPIVEPEVLMDGTHAIERCFVATSDTLRAVFLALKSAGVELSGILLKPNMVVAGVASGQSVSDEQIADSTVKCLRAQVPAEVPGIVFLSGGESESQATERLRLMNKRYHDLPWKLSFSYGRALQTTALQVWAGQMCNVSAAQKAFLERARLNSLACAGK